MTNISKTKYTTQYMGNMSFDDVYKQNAVEMLVENTEETGLVRQKEIATEATAKSIAGLNIPQHDEIVLAYNEDSSLDTKTFKLDSTTVATLKYNYTGGVLTSKQLL